MGPSFGPRSPSLACRRTAGSHLGSSLRDSPKIHRRIGENGSYKTVVQLVRRNTDLRLDTTSYHLYKLKDSAITWDGDKLAHVDGPIGAPLGYGIVQVLLGLGVKVDESKNTKITFGKLVRRRLAGAVAQTYTGEYLLSDPEFKDVMQVEPSFKSTDGYIMISKQFQKKNPKLAEKIWKAGARARKEKVKSLHKKYMELQAKSLG